MPSMDKPTFRQHISSQFNAELEDVRQRVMAMGGLVEQQIIEATQALVTLDAEHSSRGASRPPATCVWSMP